MPPADNKTSERDDEGLVHGIIKTKATYQSKCTNRKLDGQTDVFLVSFAETTP